MEDRGTKKIIDGGGKMRFSYNRLWKYKSVGDKDGFSGGRCKQMLIPLPPLAEQQRIAEKIDEVLSAISMAG